MLADLGQVEPQGGITLADLARLMQRGGVTPSRATPMDRPSLGPIPQRPQLAGSPGNLNMRPELPAPRQSGSLADILLQAMSQRGLEIPPR